MATKSRRKADEEEPEQLEEEQSEDFEDDPEGFEDESQENGSQLGFRLKEDAVEIDLPRDGNEGKHLHAIADMLDSIAA